MQRRRASRRQAESTGEACSRLRACVAAAAGARLAGSYAGLIDFERHFPDAVIVAAQLRPTAADLEPRAARLLARSTSPRLHQDLRRIHRRRQQLRGRPARLWQASELGRSDQLHEAIAEVVSGRRSQPARAKTKAAHLPCLPRSRLRGRSDSRLGHAKRAFAYLFIAQCNEAQGVVTIEKNTLSALITSGRPRSLHIRMMNTRMTSWEMVASCSARSMLHSSFSSSTKI